MVRKNSPWAMPLYLVLCCSILHCGCRSRSREQQQDRNWISTIPFKDYKELGEVSGGGGKTPTLEVVFHNKGRKKNALLFIDTGANRSSISESLASSLGLKPERYMYTHEKQIKMPLCRVDKVTIFGGNFSGEVAVEEDWNEKYGKVDGVLGADILSHTTLILDATNKKIFIIASPWLTPHGVAVNLSAKNMNEYSVNAIVNGQRRQFLLDTGAFKTTMSLDAVPSGSRKSSQPCYTIEGAVESKKVCDTLVNLKIANQQFTSLPVATFADSVYPSSLGMDVLSSGLIVIDFPSKKMYFNP